MDTPEKPAGFDEFIAAPVAENSEQPPPGFSEFIAPELKEEKYGTLGQQLLTGLEGAASAATFGLSTGVQTGLGLSTPEDIQARRDVNPASYTLGQVGGLVGSALVVPGAGAAGLMNRAGIGAAKALGVGSIQGAGVLTRVAHTGVRSAVESMLATGGDEVSKMFSNAEDVDPSEALETAVTNVGLSGLIGGAFGGALGSVGHLWDAKFGNKVSETLNDVSNAANAGALADEAKLAEDVSQAYLEQMPMLGNDSGTLKPNVDEIKGAFSRLGIKPTPGALSSRKLTQNLEAELSKGGNLASQHIAKEYETIFTGIRKKLLGTVRDATDKSEAVVGREIKEGLAETLEKELAPIEARYEKLKPEFEAIGIPEKLRQGAVENILGQELAQFTGSEAAATAQSAIKALSEVGNLDKLKSYRTLINKRIEKAARAGGEELPVLYAVKKEINNLREGAIEAAAKNSGLAGAEAKSLSSAMIREIKDTDNAYRLYKGKLKDLGTEAALGNLGSARQLLEKFKKLPDEALAKRIFDTNDINQLNFFKERFPKQFELARRFKKKELLEGSVSQAMGRNSEFDIGSYLRKVEKLGPEAKQVLFDEADLQILADSKLAFRTMPANFNTSNTAAAFSISSLLSPQGILDNATSGLKLAVLKGLPALEQATGVKGKAAGIAALKFLDSDGPIEAGAFKAAAQYVQQVINGENLISKGVQGVLSASSVIPQKTIPDDRQIDRLDKRLKEIQANESELIEVGGNTGRYLPKQGQAIGATTAAAVSYLNSLRPIEVQRSPLDTKVVVSPVDEQKFRNALTIAQQPLVVLSKIKDASISHEDITHLQTLYPALYRKLSMRMFNEINDTVAKGNDIPYETRLGLSAFLGSPLDSTMTPEFIRMNQPENLVPKPAPQQPGPKHSSMKGMEKLAHSSQTPGQNRERARSDA
jgi:hypothetical protein